MKLKRGNVEREVSGAAAIEKFKSMGYKEIYVEKQLEKNDKVTVDLEGMTVDELKAVAKERGITGVGSLKKDELLALLKDVDAGE